MTTPEWVPTAADWAAADAGDEGAREALADGNHQRITSIAVIDATAAAWAARPDVTWADDVARPA